VVGLLSSRGGTGKSVDVGRSVLEEKNLNRIPATIEDARSRTLKVEVARRNIINGDWELSRAFPKSLFDPQAVKAITRLRCCFASWIALLADGWY